MYPKEMINIVRDFYNNNNYSIRDVALIFKISKSTIHRWISDIIKVIKVKSITDYDLICTVIINSIQSNSFMTLKDIQIKIHETVNKKVSISGIYVYMKKLNLSYKKVSKHLYSNINDLNKKVKKFKKIVSKIKLNDIVCLDESFVHTNMCNDYGWSKKGHKIEKYIKSNPKKFSIMMAITNKEIISSQVYDTNLNKGIFKSVR
jgi:transposase